MNFFLFYYVYVRTLASAFTEFSAFFMQIADESPQINQIKIIVESVANAFYIVVYEISLVISVVQMSFSIDTDFRFGVCLNEPW